jgi:hypothetical protein
MHKIMLAGVIYKLLRAYPGAKRGYSYASPVDTGAWQIGDCWIVNKAGEIDPGLNASPVPIARSNLGQIVGKME